MSGAAGGKAVFIERVIGPRLAVVLVLTPLAGCSGASSGVSNQTADWKQIEIPQAGSMRIPPSMEVESDEYRTLKEQLTGTSSDTFIAQQAKLSEGSEDIANTYTRILVSCNQRTSDDYPAEEFKPGYYSDDEIAMLSDLLEGEMRTQMKASGIDILDWQPVEFVEVNGSPSMHRSYTRAEESDEKM